MTIEKTTCPICNFRTKMTPSTDLEHNANSGDRILVNKFIYDFQEPERFDVIVFKYPNNAKQNYIKRLIGLPGDNILIENGDVYLMTPNEEGGWDKEIARKPSKKVKQVLMDVDDTNYIPGKLKMMKWPSRWAQWDGKGGWTRNENESMFVVNQQDSDQWLRYRHLVPDWKQLIDSDKLPEEFDKPLNELPPGSLITDAMAYNNARYRITDQQYARLGRVPSAYGNHWVGDIGVNAWMDIESSTGELLLDLVEGGTHFTCRIDVATGKASLECDDPNVEFFNTGGVVAKPTADTSISTGGHEVLMVNADDQIHLWVDGSLVEFDAAKFLRKGRQPVPKYTAANPGDAEPAAIGGRNIAMTVSRLKVVRDVYYSSVSGDDPQSSPFNSNESNEEVKVIELIMKNPDQWTSANANRYFSKRKNQTKPMFTLEFGEDSNRDKDQFFPMGDNSTQSLDARVWPGPDRYVERDLLIGRAIYVYWPHTLNEPIPFFPNFGKMKFIR